MSTYAGPANDGAAKLLDSSVTRVTEPANEAASILLSNSVAQATESLPIELARERGMGQWSRAFGVQGPEGLLGPD